VRQLALAAGADWLSGCSPPAPATGQAAPASEKPPGVGTLAAVPTPPASLAEAMPGCTWGELRGAGVSMWRFTCFYDNKPYEADAALPGIVEVLTGPETKAVQRFPVMQLFEISAGADMASILPTVRAASPAPGNVECAFAPSETSSGQFELQATGALAERYRLVLNGTADERTLPCGMLGPSEGGQRLFFPLPGSATKIAVVFMPSDLAVFDPDTIRAAE
jgi:hypothetical protein